MTSIYDKPSYEVLAGYPDKIHSGSIIFDKKITDIENQIVIDNLMMMYMTMKPAINISVDINEPDEIIKINSPKEGICLIDSKVWFTSEGAVIGINSGSNLNEIDLYEIDNISAQKLKEYIK